MDELRTRKMVADAIILERARRVIAHRYARDAQILPEWVCETLDSLETMARQLRADAEHVPAGPE